MAILILLRPLYLVFKYLGLHPRFINFVLTQINMTNPSIHPPLSNIQAELLKLFAADIPDKHLIEIRNMIARFLLEKARDKADAVWEEKGYTTEKLEQILNKK